MEWLRAKCRRLKKWFNPTDIYSSQRVVSIMLSIEGLFPFKVVGNATRRTLIFSKIGYMFAAVHVLLFVVCFIITIWSQQSFVQFFFPTEITRLGGYFQFSLSSITMAVIYGSCIFAAKKIKSTFDNIDTVDDKLKLLYVTIDYAVGFKLNVACVICFLIVNIVYSISSYTLLATADNMPGFAIWTSNFVPPFVISLVIIHFYCVVFQITKRIFYVNQVREFHFFTNCYHYDHD